MITEILLQSQSVSLAFHPPFILLRYGGQVHLLFSSLPFPFKL